MSDDKQLIKKIEEILDITLTPMQKKYLSSENFVVEGGRLTGKRLVYCVRLSISGDEPIKFNEISPNLKNSFIEIYGKLKNGGIEVRDILFEEKRSPTILYLCDNEACENSCKFLECHHTSDVTHAKNFKKGALDTYWEEDVLIGIDLASGKDQTGYLNAHGEYVINFAKNHGLSIAEAHEHPTVKAHKHYIDTLESTKDQIYGQCGIPENLLKEGC